MRALKLSFLQAIALATVLSLAAARPCAADVPNSTPTDLGVLPGCASSQPAAVNSSGQVVGSSATADGSITLPFIWQNGAMMQLPLPTGAAAGSATSINDSGQIAGACQAAAGYQACLWTPGPNGWQVAELGVPTLDGLTFNGGLATKINNAGQVLVAVFSSAYPGHFSAAIWQEGAWTVLTEVTEWGRIPVALEGFPSKMNEQGQVLLEVVNPSKEDWNDLWIWDGAAAAEAVTYLDYANLNNSGQVVGVCYDPATQGNYNFTYDISTRALVKTPESDTGYRLANINDRGQVLVAQDIGHWGPVNDFLGWTTDIGITSWEAWLDPTSVKPLGTVIGTLNSAVDFTSLQFNVNCEVSGDIGVSSTAFFASAAAGVVLLDDLVANTTLGIVGMNDSGVVIGFSGDHAFLWGQPAQNQPPVANAGPDQTVTLPHDGNPAPSPAQVILDGSGSTDPDGAILGYQWSEAGTLIAAGVKPTVDLSAGTHTITLTVWDRGCLTSTHEVVITVGPEPNQAPVANAGPDQTVTASGATASVTLDGSASTDQDNDPLTFSWAEGTTALGTDAKPTVALAPGTHTITLTVTDPYGATGTDTVTVTVGAPADTVPPVITVPQDIAATATSTAGAVVTFTVTAIDNVDGAVPVTSIPPSGSTFPLGTTKVSCTAADKAGNSASASFKVNVTYSWSGFLQPIDPPTGNPPTSASVFKAGTVVPVRFQLTGASAGITNAVATLSYAKVSSGVVGTDVEATSTAAATSGNQFRYDATTGQYVYNWSTKGLTAGSYQLSVDMGDGVSRTVIISLK